MTIAVYAKAWQHVIPVECAEFEHDLLPRRYKDAIHAVNFFKSGFKLLHGLLRAPDAIMMFGQLNESGIR